MVAYFAGQLNKLYALKSALLMLSFLGFQGLLLHAQVKISGRITNSKSEGVPFATVKFKRDSLGVPSNYCIASKSGLYSFSISRPFSRGFLEFSSVGYQSQVLILNDTSKEMTINCILQSAQTDLPDLYIKADKPIQVSGDTITYRAESFHRGNEHNVGDLLLNMPGFKVDQDGRIYFNGFPISDILIDGDNITGSNYELVTKNLSTLGIDKIQVIRNYKDPEDLVSKLHNSNKQVVNIKFTSGLHNKIFGNVAVNAGIPSTAYDINAQAVGLLGKIKFLSFEGLNTIGKSQDAGQNAGNSKAASQDGHSEFSELSFRDLTAVATIDNSKELIGGLQDFTRNKTGIASVNGYYTPLKFLSVKENLDFLKDDYVKTENTVDQSYLPTQTITLLQNRTLDLRSASWTNSLFLNYLPNSKNQVAIILKATNLKVTNSSSGTLQDTAYAEKEMSNLHQFGSKIMFNRIINSAKGAAFSFDAGFAFQTLPGSYLVSPPFYGNFFFPTTPLFKLFQSERQQNSDWMANASLIQKFSRHSLQLSLKWNDVAQSLSNGIDANSHNLNLNADSTNNFAVKRSTISLMAQDVWTISKRLILTFGLEEQQADLESQNKTKVTSDQVLNRLFILPSFSGQVNFSEVNRLDITVAAQNKYPSISQLCPGFMVNGISSVSNGSDSLSMKLIWTGQLIFSHIDVARQGIIFFSGINVSNTPYLSIANEFPGATYTYSSFLPTKKSTGFFTAFSRLYKLIPEAHLRLTPELDITAGQTYSMVTSQGYSTQFVQFKAGISGTINIGPVRVVGDANYTMLSQRRLDHVINVSRTSTSQFQNKLDVNWKLHSKWFVDLLPVYDIFYPPGQKSQGILLTNAELTYHPNGAKWVLGMKYSNLFDKTHFEQSVISPTNTTVTNFSIFPRFLQGSVQFNF